MKIITYRCNFCGKEWQENVQDVYKTGVMKECPLCHNKDSKVIKKKIVVDKK